MRRLLAVLGVIVLAVAVVVVVRLANHDDRPRADVGAQLTMEDGSRVQGYPTELLLPFGSYLVTVGAAHDEMPRPCCADDPAPTRAPRGGSFVGVSVSQLDTQRLQVPVVQPGHVLPKPTFTLRVAGDDATDVREYALTGLDHDWDPTVLLNRDLEAYVAVDGHPGIDRLSVAVDYDGVTQTVDPERGSVETPASGLRVSDAQGMAQDCGLLHLPRRFVERPGLPPGCSTTVQRLAYVAGPGWAPPLETWLVVRTGVDATVALDRLGRGPAVHYSAGATFATLRIRVDVGGARPVATWSEGATVVSVFAQPASPPYALRTSVTYPDVDGGRRPLTGLTLTWVQES